MLLRQTIYRRLRRGFQTHVHGADHVQSAHGTVVEAEGIYWIDNTDSVESR